MRIRQHLFLLTVWLAFTMWACGGPEPARDDPGTLPESTAVDERADSAMVVSAHPLASEAGLLVLRKGGNAVDAAVTVQFTLAVVYPRAGNIGGGGFMVLRQADGTAAALDFREKAPAGAHRDMYLGPGGSVRYGLSTESHLAAGVPGSVRGMWEAHQKYGKLDWKELLQPAIDLAQNGFELTREEARALNAYVTDKADRNSMEPKHWTKQYWLPGDTVYQPDLARTLERIRDEGVDGFYKGETAKLIEAEMRRGGGLITAADLEAYTAEWREPLRGAYKNYKLISMPPPSSGGVALFQLLSMVEPHPISDWGAHDARTLHLLVEAERRVYADRSEYLGDPDFYPVPVDSLLRPDYLRHRMADFNPEKATASSQVKPGKIVPPESPQTTHFSIVDAEGNAVSLTTTLNTSFGSGIMVGGAGFLLNNEMDDFSIKPGVPNVYGLVGGEANAIAPGKRMLSSMTPTILEKDGELFMVVGTPGGSRIITSVFQVILNVIEHNMDMQEAVSAGRFHHQWLPDQIFYEMDLFEDYDALRRLRSMGHTLFERSDWSRVDAILIKENGTLEGGADPRGDDAVSGY